MALTLCVRGMSALFRVSSRSLVTSTTRAAAVRDSSGAEAGPDERDGDGEKTTHFGFKRVPTALKEGMYECAHSCTWRA